MVIIMVISFIIIFAVIALAVITTSKAYGFKHTVDPVDQASTVEAHQEREPRH
ncbi:YtzI protein [Bacillus sp. FJAT-18017]|uniref:YtzI protein n=1 Tax=Bacillus sp. FJAT-18017 TaxID=1705566 RepID=UPI0009EC8A01|nr:YtzI protein [Bacillus sp. FJAT-18017]